MNPTQDVIIIGGGTIGCAVALEVARQGASVTVLERGQPGQEASSAAAGMLAVQAEIIHGLRDPLAALCWASHALYPEFVRQLEDETGNKIGYLRCGSVLVSQDYQETAMLANYVERQRESGRPVEELTAEALRELEPGLSPALQAGILLPEDHAVNNRQLIKALVAGIGRYGGTIRTHTPVLALEVRDDRVHGVRLPGEVLQAGVVVNAAGCWSGQVYGGVPVPTRPVRGQIVQLQQTRQRLRHLIHSTGCYLVPWPDGRTLVGSTVENVGYDKTVTAKAVQELLSAALRIAAELSAAEVVTAWAGLRPDTPDNLPILGRTRLSNYILATGHFRNGILLTPITAKLIAELILEGKPSLDLEPFSPARFEKDV